MIPVTFAAGSDSGKVTKNIKVKTDAGEGARTGRLRGRGRGKVTLL